MAHIPWARVHGKRARQEHEQEQQGRKNEHDQAALKLVHDAVSSMVQSHPRPQHQQRHELAASTIAAEVSQAAEGTAVPWVPDRTATRARDDDRDALHWGTVLLVIALGAVLAVALGCVVGMNMPPPALHAMQRLCII